MLVVLGCCSQCAQMWRNRQPVTVPSVFILCLTFLLLPFNALTHLVIQIKPSPKSLKLYLHWIVAEPRQRNVPCVIKINLWVSVNRPSDMVDRVLSLDYWYFMQVERSKIMMFSVTRLIAMAAINMYQVFYFSHFLCGKIITAPFFKWGNWDRWSSNSSTAT